MEDELMERKSLEELAQILKLASPHVGSTIFHKKSGTSYLIIGVHFRESDMAVCYVYTPFKSEFSGKVRFSRSISEMDFGTRFIFTGHLICSPE